MGILDKIFGKNSNSEEENKWAIYLNLCNQIASVDGVFSDEEALFSREYLHQKASNFSDSDWDRICSNAESMGQDGMNKAKDLSENEKYELINYLAGIANSDGKFDGKEFSYIYVIAIVMGLDRNKVDGILSNFDNIDYDDVEKQMNEMMSHLKNSGLI